jgi:hypothetical protein
LYGLYLISHPFSPTETQAELEAKFGKVLTEITKDGPFFNVVLKQSNKK